MRKNTVAWVRQWLKTYLPQTASVILPVKSKHAPPHIWKRVIVPDELRRSGLRGSWPGLSERHHRKRQKMLCQRWTAWYPSQTKHKTYSSIPDGSHRQWLEARNPICGGNKHIIKAKQKWYACWPTPMKGYFELYLEAKIIVKLHVFGHFEHKSSLWFLKSLTCVDSKCPQ